MTGFNYIRTLDQIYQNHILKKHLWLVTVTLDWGSVGFIDIFPSMLVTYDHQRVVSDNINKLYFIVDMTRKSSVVESMPLDFDASSSEFVMNPSYFHVTCNEYLPSAQCMSNSNQEDFEFFNSNVVLSRMFADKDSAEEYLMYIKLKTSGHTAARPSPVSNRWCFGHWEQLNFDAAVTV